MNKFKLKRKDNDEELELTQSLHWVDEFDWAELAQSSPRYSIGGSMIVQQGKKKAGRPITLMIDEHELITRLDYKTLQKWSEVPLLKMQLTHGDGRTYKVMFRNHEAAIDCEPVFHEIPESDDDLFIGQVNLMTI